ncbi:MAG: ATP-binding protein [Bacteroidota bacterium]
MEEGLAQQYPSLVKVVLFGPESTGKTTLAKQLAAHYKTTWVPEYMRAYLQDKWDLHGQRCEQADLLPIARGQMALENERAKDANRLLVCDTDLLELKVYAEAYYEGNCPSAIAKQALKNQYHLYLLTQIDVPWEPDDLRDRPADRAYMFELFKTALKKYQRTFILLSGEQKDRFLTATHAINKLLDHGRLD